MTTHYIYAVTLGPSKILMMQNLKNPPLTMLTLMIWTQ